MPAAIARITEEAVNPVFLRLRRSEFPAWPSGVEPQPIPSAWPRIGSHNFGNDGLEPVGDRKERMVSVPRFRVGLHRPEEPHFVRATVGAGNGCVWELRSIVPFTPESKNGLTPPPELVLRPRPGPDGDQPVRWQP